MWHMIQCVQSSLLHTAWPHVCRENVYIALDSSIFKAVAFAMCQIFLLWSFHIVITPLIARINALTDVCNCVCLCMWVIYVSVGQRCLLLLLFLLSMTSSVQRSKSCLLFVYQSLSAQYTMTLWRNNIGCFSRLDLVSLLWWALFVQL